MTGDFSTPNYKLSHYGKVKRGFEKAQKNRRRRNSCGDFFGFRAVPAAPAAPLWVKMRGGQIGDAQTAGIRARREIVADSLSGIRQLACRHRQDPSGRVSGRGISSFCRRTSRKISVLIFAPFFSAIKPMGKVKAGSSPGDCPWRKIRRSGYPISGSAPVALFAFPPVLFPAPYTKKGGTSGGLVPSFSLYKTVGGKGMGASQISFRSIILRSIFRSHMRRASPSSSG